MHINSLTGINGYASSSLMPDAGPTKRGKLGSKRFTKWLKK